MPLERKEIMPPVQIFLGDLTYDTVSLSTDSNPLNVGFIAAYCKKMFGADVDIILFKYIEELENALRAYEGQFVSFHCEDPEVLEKCKNRKTHELRRPVEAETIATKVALELIAPQDDDPVTIFLTEGTFSPSTTGESFPIIMISNMSLIGESEELSIIDAENSANVMILYQCQNISIENLTVTGGNASPSNTAGLSIYYGGGIYIKIANPDIFNVTVTGNYALENGGGIYTYFAIINLSNMTISGNTANIHGGGIVLLYSNPILAYITLSIC